MLCKLLHIVRYVRETELENFYAYSFINTGNWILSNWLVAHRRSIAKRGGCFQRRLFVSVFVRSHDNFQTTKRKTIQLGG